MAPLYEILVSEPAILFWGAFFLLAVGESDEMIVSVRFWIDKGGGDGDDETKEIYCSKRLGIGRPRGRVLNKCLLMIGSRDWMLNFNLQLHHVWQLNSTLR